MKTDQQSASLDKAISGFLVMVHTIPPRTQSAADGLGVILGNLTGAVIAERKLVALRPVLVQAREAYSAACQAHGFQVSLADLPRETLE